ncbi:GNAT family N-acetyltransferase [Georgenia subflava]|uniref:GNAT family N-acetyltransferase n=1 Tax=Georgenia subflava TaxID=1622177 RepID=A0A6N7EIA6_9MICO|nr:GNAT family N-acetyltransferase [Georgenia subflava]MPV37800.1 GNAT family N-acetyltransferase [Georgenia subflava]
MDAIYVGDQRYAVDRASADDLPALVELLRDDELGAARESAPPEAYEAAFAAIDADPNQFLACVRDGAGDVVATMQLTLMPSLSRGGAVRLNVETVRVGSGARGRGLGGAMFEWAHEFGRRRGASIVQLTSDKGRIAAHRFYARLGYEATHEGFKRPL